MALGGPRNKVDPYDLPPNVVRAETARCLWLDRVTAEVVQALKTGEIRAILLRGPALVHELYQDGAFRPYDDVDLLIDPCRMQAAGQILSRLAFRDVHAQVSVHERIPYAQRWERPSDGAMVDLHSTLLEAQAAPGTVWSIRSQETARLKVGGAEVDVLTRAPLAAVVVLHAAHHGIGAPKPLQDLARAIDEIPRPDWEQAAELSRGLGAEGAFGAGLRLLPEGAGLAARLDLPTTAPVAVALHASSAPFTADGFARLLAAPGLRRKFELLARELVPTPALMRLYWPLARRGRVGLWAAYVWRLAGLVVHAGPGLRALRKAQRAEVRRDR